MSVAEAQDALVVGDERAAEFDCGRNQEPISGIPVLEVVKLVAPRRRAMTKQRGLDPRTLQEAGDPILDRKVQFYSPGIDEQSDLPS